jgi:hypothetical protein
MEERDWWRGEILRLVVRGLGALVFCDFLEMWDALGAATVDWKRQAWAAALKEGCVRASIVFIVL